MDKRQFTVSISAKIENRRRMLFEASPAPLYGGPDGLYRVRIDRRWYNSPDGEPLFFDSVRLMELIRTVAFGVLEEPAPAPNIPPKARVSVWSVVDGEKRYECGWTVTPPIRAFDGRWVIAVMLAGKTVFMPVENIIYHEGKPCRDL